MACVNPDGSITQSARAMLELLRTPMTHEEAAEAAGQPLFKVRSSFRQMAESGLIENDGDSFRTSSAGMAKLDSKG